MGYEHTWQKRYRAKMPTKRLRSHEEDASSSDTGRGAKRDLQGSTGRVDRTTRAMGAEGDIVRWGHRRDSRQQSSEGVAGGGPARRTCRGTNRSAQLTRLLLVEREGLPVLLLDLLELLVNRELLIRGELLPLSLDVGKRDDT